MEAGNRLRRKRSENLQELDTLRRESFRQFTFRTAKTNQECQTYSWASVVFLRFTGGILRAIILVSRAR